MADLHTSQGTLPEDRADLYERCVDLLLDYWQQRKVAHDPQGKLVVEVGLLDALGIEKGQLKRNLYRIAFEAHERQGKSPQRGPRTANVQEKDLERVLWPALGSEEKFHTALCYIRDRAGLLLWGGGDVYTFPHRSFQEYLAACHLGTLDDPFQETARRVRDDLEWWREVFLLEAGRVREHPGVAVSLVHALCPISVQAVTDPTATDWRAAALAAQALVELRLPQQIQEKRRQGEYATLFEAELRHVKEWLVALLKVGALPARERVESGRALAHLDDPRPGVRVEPQTELPDIVWCQIPAGPFLMGTQEKDIPALVERLGGEARWYEYETPQREVTLPHFYISRYPVTNAQFAAFVQAGGYTDPKWLMKCWTEAGRRWLKENKVTGPSRFGNPFDLLNHPVVGVSWYEALAFCRWLTERFRIADSDQGIRESGNQALITDSLITDSLITVRLPTEAEWEKAARGTDGRIYPWGDAPDPDRANYYDTGIGATSAVGCFPAGRGPCDALDMSGNVWEWCGTKWRDSYREPADESLIGTGPRVVRGGSWGSSLRDVRCAGRDWYGPLAGLGTLGFRMVVSPGSP
jgi:formylglycine-generating enzyme required for sulfatase activity